MFSAAIIKALQVYGIAIVISLVVAVLIKVMVVLTGRVERRPPQVTAKAIPASPSAEGGVRSPSGASIAPEAKVPGEVVAAISAAIASIMGPHRILSISEKKSCRSGF